jgi:hypothetical protein
MGAVGGQWEILADADTFALGPCEFRFQLGEPVVSEAPEPPPNVLRDQPAARTDAPEPMPDVAQLADGPFSTPSPAIKEELAQPMPDIWKDKPAQDGAGVDEGPQLERAANA